MPAWTGDCWIEHKEVEAHERIFFHVKWLQTSSAQPLLGVYIKKMIFFKFLLFLPNILKQK